MPIQLLPERTTQPTRRDVLQAGVAGLAGVAASGLMPALSATVHAQLKFDPHTFVLMSDSHIDSDPTRVVRDTNMADHYMQIVESVRQASAANPDGHFSHVFVNGDLVMKDNQDEIGCYQKLAELSQPLRDAGLPMTFTLGNHDTRDAFRWVIQRQQDQSAAPAITPVPTHHVGILEAERANWFCLDTLDGLDQTPGLLGEAQRRWLDARLGEYDDKPALIVIHHGPQFAAPGDRIWGLRDTLPLFDILNKHNHVSALFHGHAHTWITDGPDLYANFPRIGLPTTCYTFANAQTAGWVICRLETNQLTLTMNTLDPEHTFNGQVVEVPFRM